VHMQAAELDGDQAQTDRQHDQCRKMTHQSIISGADSRFLCRKTEIK
jgi:hypothetical protein